MKKERIEYEFGCGMFEAKKFMHDEILRLQDVKCEANKSQTQEVNFKLFHPQTVGVVCACVSL